MMTRFALIAVLVLGTSCAMHPEAQEIYDLLQNGIEKLEDGLDQPDLSAADRDWITAQIASLKESQAEVEDAGKKAAAYDVGASGANLLEILLYALGGGALSPLALKLARSLQEKRDAKLAEVMAHKIGAQS